MEQKLDLNPFQFTKRKGLTLGSPQSQRDIIIIMLLVIW